MRILVYGAGAIGGVLGGLLHRAGHDVVLIARGEHLAAIQSSGLRVVAAETDLAAETDQAAETNRVDMPAIGDPGELTEPPDAVLLTMKTGDTAAAVDRLTMTVPPDTPIVCVQNAVENERIVARTYPNAYGVCVMFPATHLTPGVVEARCAPVPGILDIGRFPTGVDEQATGIAAAFGDAGFVSVPRPDIMRWKYRKLVMNLGNALDAVCERSEDTTALMREIRAEGETVLEAADIPVISTEQDAERRGDILKPRPDADQELTGSSTWQSLHRRTGSIEATYLNGEIGMLGRVHGVPTPLNDVALRLALAAARGDHPPRSLSAAAVRDRLAGVLPVE